eukprot:NODE_525_length_833_cov_14.793367_g464_i0.p1 GENE.NODE_525_length_833_cov_14.793367_g464_i0~~NODE_525_length_833_cov_14.793367_g464_i0.p1  ORF type:complete len:176 (-),score=27.31 NODE_525_length_833_cov_14.793367_g464_i0:304-759(-)
MACLQTTTPTIAGCAMAKSDGGLPLRLAKGKLPRRAHNKLHLSCFQLSDVTAVIPLRLKHPLAVNHHHQVGWSPHRFILQEYCAPQKAAQHSSSILISRASSGVPPRTVTRPVPPLHLGVSPPPGDLLPSALPCVHHLPDYTQSWLRLFSS